MKPKEGVLHHQEVSKTAATAGHKLYGESGVMTYRVMLKTGAGGVVRCDVDAATGDQAANLALEEYFGGMVMSVNPAPQDAQTARKELAE